MQKRYLNMSAQHNMLRTEEGIPHQTPAKTKSDNL